MCKLWFSNHYIFGTKCFVVICFVVISLVICFVFLFTWNNCVCFLRIRQHLFETTFHWKPFLPYHRRLYFFPRKLRYMTEDSDICFVNPTYLSNNLLRLKTPTFFLKPPLKSIILYFLCEYLMKIFRVQTSLAPIKK